MITKKVIEFKGKKYYLKETIVSKSEMEDIVKKCKKLKYKVKVIRGKTMSIQGEIPCYVIYTNPKYKFSGMFSGSWL